MGFCFAHDYQIFCLQIAQKNGVIQDWGLVEYNSAEEAENTMAALHDAMLDETKIRVQYCIPNIHAINIYMSFVNNPLDNRYSSHAEGCIIL